jgi:hypothetical protein
MNTSRVFGWATLFTATSAVTLAIGFVSPVHAARPSCMAAREVGKDSPDATRLSALLVLFLPWDEPTTPPLPTGDPTGGTGNNSNGSGGNNNNNGSGPPQGGQEPPPPSGGPPVTSTPEPATLISGGLGLGMLLLARWRRRRGQPAA